jgi:hypothetical protein
LRNAPGGVTIRAMAWSPPPDPYYRRLMANIADTEWQIVECEFLNASMRGRVEPPAILSAAVPQDAPPPKDHRVVSLATAYECNYWMMTFRITEAELRDGVARVGNSVAALRRHFGK